MPESIRIGIKAKGNLKEMTLNLVPSQHAKLVKVCAVSPRNTTRLLTYNSTRSWRRHRNDRDLFVDPL